MTAFPWSETAPRLKEIENKAIPIALNGMALFNFPTKFLIWGIISLTIRAILLS